MLTRLRFQNFDRIRNIFLGLCSLCPLVKDALHSAPSLKPKVHHFALHKIMPITILDCYDGDTCHGTIQNHPIRIRLIGIDAPEMNDPISLPYSELARQQLLRFLTSDTNADVRVRLYRQDRYQRHLGELFVGGKSVNRELLSEGWVFAYHDPTLPLPWVLYLQHRARQKHRGVWKTKLPHPSVFRRQQRWTFRISAR